MTVHLLLTDAPFLRAGWVGTKGRNWRSTEGWFTTRGALESPFKMLCFCGLHRGGGGESWSKSRNLLTCADCLVALDLAIEMQIVHIGDTKKLKECVELVPIPPFTAPDDPSKASTMVQRQNNLKTRWSTRNGFAAWLLERRQSLLTDAPRASTVTG